ncbi:DUF6894 family protein [Rhizobium sp. S152]|uniref:DUF6894 family protein n=1 Tax=Rhizobium sp. S152 TaxID=3055038 RepID=UPI003FA79AFD
MCEENVPRYIFQLLDGTGADANEHAHDFDTFDDARSHAKTLLCEMVQNGLPDAPGAMMSVEIFGADKGPLTELRMTFDEIAKRV